MRVRERYGERGREKESGEECERKRVRTGREGANLFTLEYIKERAKFAQKNSGQLLMKFPSLKFGLSSTSLRSQKKELVKKQVTI